MNQNYENKDPFADGSQTSNYSGSNAMQNKDLTGANSANTLGIIGIIANFVCCSPLGLILGIIGFNKSKTAINAYEVEPHESGQYLYGKAKQAKTLNIIAISIGALFTLLGILYWVFVISVASSGFGNFAEEFERGYEEGRNRNYETEDQEDTYDSTDDWEYQEDIETTEQEENEVLTDTLTN